MADVSNRTLNVYINTGDAQKAYDKLIAKEKTLKDAIAQTSDPKQIQRLNQELTKLQEPIDRATKKLNGQLGPSMKDLQKTARDLGNQLSHMSQNDADFTKVLKQYRQAQVELKEMKTNVVKLQEGFEQTKNANPFGRVLEFAKGALLASGITEVVGQFTGFLKGSIDEALQADESADRFKATLENLGRSDAFERITHQADAIAEHFKYLDNDDVVGVFNKLVDYGKLTEQQMNQLLPVIVNFAAKTRQPIDAAADVIIKAMEGNGKAMKTFGVEVSATGTTAQNFNEIMTTLKSKVDGAGDAFMKTAAGGIATTKQAVKDLQEDIGRELLPALEGVEKWAYGAIKGIKLMWQGLKDNFSDLKTFFTEGFGAAAAQRALREAQEMKDLENEFAQKQIDKFAGSSKDDIASEISRLNQVLELKQKAVDAKTLQRRKDAGLITSPEEIEATQQGIRLIKQELDGLYKLQDSRDQGVLGIDGTKPDTSAADAARKKALEQYKQLMSELHKLQNDIALLNMDEEEREFTQMEQKFADLRLRAKGHKDALLLIEKLYNEERNALTLKYARKNFEDEQKYLEEQEKNRAAYFQKALDNAQKSAQRISSIIADGQKKNQANQLAGVQLDILQAPKNPFSQNRLELNKKLLDLEMQQELQAKDLTENQKLLIEEQYREKKKQAEADYWNNMINVVLSFTQQALAVLQQFQQNKTNQENQELDRDKKLNDKKKDNLKKQLDNKRITQQDYDRQVAELDKRQQEKEKQVHLQQFRREQRMAIVQAVISGAQGVQKSIAEWGMPFALPWIALTAVTTAAQIAAISKQQPPEFGAGGLLTGPAHKSKSRGLPVTDPETGQVQALLEGGESITNKDTMQDPRKYTATGTPSQIISQLNALHGGVAWDQGATLVPAWQLARPQPMNFDSINSSMRTVRMFAAGGTWPPASAGSTSSQDPAIFQQLAQVIGDLQQTLDGGIQAGILLTDLEKATKRRQAIIDDATMKA